MEKRMCRANVEFYRKRLEQATDDGTRKALVVLLRMEETKLARLSERELVNSGGWPKKSKAVRD